MRSIRSLISISLSAAIAFVIGCSQSTGLPPVPPETNYLPVAAVQSLALVNAPPYALGSSEDHQELQQILSLQASRSALDCQRANTEVTITLERFFGPEYGPMTKEQVKQWTQFFDRVYNDVNAVTNYAKAHYNRPRPFVEDSKIEPCIAPPNSASFPSSHAAMAEAFALVLDSLLPEMKTAIDARASQIAMDRVIAGVHRQSEIDAGQRLGDLIYEEMEKNIEFEKTVTMQKMFLNQY
jgi:acid phosphatase (class A)